MEVLEEAMSQQLTDAGSLFQPLDMIKTVAYSVISNDNYQ